MPLFCIKNSQNADIVLLVNHKILSLVDDEKLSLNQDETISLSKEYLSRLIKDVKSENILYLSKNYKDMPIDTFIKEVISYLKEYDFIREFEQGYKVYPSVSKLTGYIPKDTLEQLELFGGAENEAI